MKQQEFKIPEKIAHRYRIVGDLGNVANWSGSLYYPRINESSMQADLERISYVLIALESNYIVPVTNNDDHRVGYEYLEGLVSTGLVPYEEYVSIYARGTTYIYNMADKKVVGNFIKAFTKLLKYGGGKGCSISLPSDKRFTHNFKIALSDYVKVNGDVSNIPVIYHGTGNLSAAGKELLKSIEEFLTVVREYHKELAAGVLIRISHLEKRILRLYSKVLSVLSAYSDMFKCVKGLQNIIDTRYTVNTVDTAISLMCTHSGAKNLIHTTLKTTPKNLALFFYDTEEALNRLNEMSNI
jgi:hypothetical protein